jgi:perosamine synthetase
VDPIPAMNMNNLKQYVKARHPALFKALKAIAAKRIRRKNRSYPRIMAGEISAVEDVLKTPYWNMAYGRNLVHERLEEEFAQYVGTKYAVAANTGGMALQMALRALGVRPGDEVVHQIDTCVADAFAVMAAGGIPIFADIDRETFMLSRQSVESLVSPNTKVIMPIHMWGNPEDMDMVLDVAKKYKLTVLEDACLSLGAEWGGDRVGSIGAVGVFSFGCMKPIQAGEGGMVTTNDECLAKEVRTMRHWGDMTWEYGVRDHKVLSWNGRMSEIVAAVALEQLRAYPGHLKALRESVTKFRHYLKNIDGMKLHLPSRPEATAAYTQVVVKLNEGRLGLSKKDLMKALQEQGVEVWHANFEPINSLSFFKNAYWKDWIIKGDVRKIEQNYTHDFVASEEVYRTLGLGFSKKNFLSQNALKCLIEKLERALTRRS